MTDEEREEIEKEKQKAIDKIKPVFTPKLTIAFILSAVLASVGWVFHIPGLFVTFCLILLILLTVILVRLFDVWLEHMIIHNRFDDLLDD